MSEKESKSRSTKISSSGGQDEWRRGLKALEANSLEKLQRALPALEREVSLLFCFTFRVVVRPGDCVKIVPCVVFVYIKLGNEAFEFQGFLRFCVPVQPHR